MALQPHQRSAIPQSRARGSPLTHAGHRSSGSDDHLSSERRGTPHETPEGLDRGDTTRSDHPDHLHTTLEHTAPKDDTDALDKPSSPGSAEVRATPAGTPSARLPASPPSAEALLDPKGFDLNVAAVKPSAVDSPHGLSTTQPSSDARTGMRPYVPAEDVTGFSTDGMEALQLQVQQFVQCAAEGAAALMPSDVGVIARLASDLHGAGERYMATAELLASYRGERCAFQTCVGQTAATYGKKLSNRDCSANGELTEAALCFNVLNGELGAFEAEVDEEQATLDQLEQRYRTSRLEYLAEQARLLQMLEGAAPSKLARANAAALNQHQSQIRSLADEVAQQRQAIVEQSRATAALGRQAEEHNAEVQQGFEQMNANLTQGFQTFGTMLQASLAGGFQELAGALRSAQHPAAVELPSPSEAGVAPAASNSEVYVPFDATATADAALPVQEDDAPTFDPVSRCAQLLTQARQAGVDEHSLEILERARTHLTRSGNEQAAETASDAVAAAQPGSSISPNPPLSSSVRDQEGGSLTSSPSDELVRAQAEVERLHAELNAVRDSDDAGEVPTSQPRTLTPDAGSPRVPTTEPLRTGATPELPPATPTQRHPSLTAIAEDGNGDTHSGQGLQVAPEEFVALMGLNHVMNLKDAILARLQAETATELDKQLLAAALSPLGSRFTRVVGQADHFRRRHLPCSCCGPWPYHKSMQAPEDGKGDACPASRLFALARARAGRTPPGGAGFVTTPHDRDAGFPSARRDIHHPRPLGEETRPRPLGPRRPLQCFSAMAPLGFRAWERSVSALRIMVHDVSVKRPRAAERIGPGHL